MNILILNSILFTAENNIIPQIKSIKDTMIYNLCLGFIHLGHKVTLCAAEEYKPQQKETYVCEVLFFQSNLTRLFPPTLLPLHLSLISFLYNNKNKYDFIISSEVFAINSLFSSIMASSKTLIWQELGVHQRKMKKLPSMIWHNIIARIFMKNALIVPRSNKAKRFIKQYNLQVTEDFVDHGVNSDRLKANQEKKNQFIVVGQLVPRKNIESIILKFDAFLSKYKKTDFILYIAGKGPLELELKQLIKNLNREKNIILLGQVPHDELNKYLSQAQAFLADPIKELNMIALSEAIASGTPVLTNDVPYSSEYVKENELGIVNKNWNEDDLNKIIQNNQVYVENCIKCGKSLSIETSASKLIELYLKQQRFI